MLLSLLLSCSLLSSTIAVDSIRIPLSRRSSRLSRREISTLDHYTAAADHIRHKYGFAPNGRRKRQNSAEVAITDQYGDQSYFASISIGTPGQNFNVILDTGSADLWVADSSCSSCSSSTPSYDSSKSSSYSAPSNSSQGVTITYGSGEVAGTLADDSVNLGGFTVNPQTFLAVDQTSQGLLTGSVSGIIGLAFQSIASTGATPFWEVLVNNNQLSNPVISFWLNRLIDDSSATNAELYGGEFTLGATNTSLYTGSIEFLDFPSGVSQSFWLLEISQVTVQGNQVSIQSGTGSLAAIDTGTTLIGGPEDEVSSIWGNVQGAQAMSGEYDGFWSFPCNTNVSVAISFGGSSWPISSEDMNLGAIDQNGEQCLGGIFVLSSGTTTSKSDSSLASGTPGWVVGDTFLKNVYTVFRASPASIGFAPLSDQAGGSSGTPSGYPSSAEASGTGNPLPSGSGSSSSGSSSGASVAFNEGVLPWACTAVFGVAFSVGLLL